MLHHHESLSFACVLSLTNLNIQAKEDGKEILREFCDKFSVHTHPHRAHRKLLLRQRPNTELSSLSQLLALEQTCPSWRVS